MTKRVLLLVPEGLDFDALTNRQRTKLDELLIAYKNPMPKSKADGGKQVLDALVEDDFRLANITSLGLNWTILGQWKRTQTNKGKNKRVRAIHRVDEVTPPDVAEITKRLVSIKDKDGVDTQVGIYESHKWLGWEDLL